MANIPFYYDYINTVDSSVQPANMHYKPTNLARRSWPLAFATCEK